MVKCDVCGDESNSAPGLMCGRVDNPGDEPCTGTYRAESVYVITASVYVEGVRTPQEAAAAVEEFNRGGEPLDVVIEIRLPDEDSGFEWSYVGDPEPNEPSPPGPGMLSMALDPKYNRKVLDFPPDQREYDDRGDGQF